MKIYNQIMVQAKDLFTESTGTKVKAESTKKENKNEKSQKNQRKNPISPFKKIYNQSNKNTLKDPNKLKVKSKSKSAVHTAIKKNFTSSTIEQQDSVIVEEKQKCFSTYKSKNLRELHSPVAVPPGSRICKSPEQSLISKRKFSWSRSEQVANKLR